MPNIHGPKDKGRTLRSGAPMRSVKESLVSRAPGQRAAEAYTTGQPAAEIRSERVSAKPTSGARRSTDLVNMNMGRLGHGGAGPNMPHRFRSGPRNFSPNERVRLLGKTDDIRYTSAVKHLKSGSDASYTPATRKGIRTLTTPNPVGRLGASRYLRNAATTGAAATPKGGALKAMARAAVGTAGRWGARLAGPVGAGLLAMDAYDTAKATQKTVGAYKELGRELDKGKEAKAAAQSALSSFTAAHPAAGASLEKKQKKRDEYHAVKSAAGGQVASISDVSIGKKGSIYTKGRGKF